MEVVFFADSRLASAAVASLLALLWVTWLCEKRLGGTTGDCLGAAIEIAEVVFLLAWVI
jgi:cobalamin synthase